MDRHSDGAVAMARMVATSEVGREKEKKCISSYEIRVINLRGQNCTSKEYPVCGMWFAHAGRWVLIDR